MKKIASTQPIRKPKQRTPEAKKVEGVKGHPLMRRSQISLEKTKEHKNYHKPIKEQKSSTYYWNVKKKLNSITDKVKTDANSKEKKKFNQRLKDPNSSFLQVENNCRSLSNKQKFFSPATPKHSPLPSYTIPLTFQSTEDHTKLTDSLKAYQIYKINQYTEQKINEDYQFGATIKRDTTNYQELSTKLHHYSSTFCCRKSSFMLLDQSPCIDSTENKITLHLQVLRELAEYSTELLQLYENSGDWQQLVFLVYKIYYLEREKVLQALRGGASNPFQLTICQIGSDDLQRMKKSLEGTKLLKEIEIDNKLVLESLRSFYNLIEKSNSFITMEEQNNFTREIFKDMSLQINLLKDIGSKDAKVRMCRVFRCAFLIAELEGNLIISYGQALQTENQDKYLEKATKLFHQCLIF